MGFGKHGVKNRMTAPPPPPLTHTPKIYLNASKKGKGRRQSKYSMTFKSLSIYLINLIISINLINLISYLIDLI